MADKTEKKPGFVAKAKAAVKGFCARVAKFFRDTKSELKKVVWPSKQDVKTNTIVVLVTVAIAAVVMTPAGCHLWWYSGPDHRRLRIILKRRVNQNGRINQAGR